MTQIIEWKKHGGLGWWFGFRLDPNLYEKDGYLGVHLESQPLINH